MLLIAQHDRLYHAKPAIIGSAGMIMLQRPLRCSLCSIFNPITIIRTYDWTTTLQYTGSPVASSLKVIFTNLLRGLHSTRHDKMVRPSVRLSRRSTAAPAAGGFAAEVGRGPAANTDQ